MLFLGWQGIYTFLLVLTIVCLLIIIFAKKLNYSSAKKDFNLKSLHKFSLIRSMKFYKYITKIINKSHK